MILLPIVIFHASDDLRRSASTAVSNVEVVCGGANARSPQVDVLSFLPHTWRLFGVCRGLSEQVLRYGFGDPQCFCVAQGRKPATELIDVQREQLLNRELAARISAGPEGRSAGASLRTVLLRPRDRRLLLRRHADRLGANVPRQQSLTLFSPARGSASAFCCSSPLGTGGPIRLAAASAHFLATQQAGWPPLYALTAEGFDAVEMRLGSGGDSHSDQVSPRGDHAS